MFLAQADGARKGTAMYCFECKRVRKQQKWHSQGDKHFCHASYKVIKRQLKPAEPITPAFLEFAAKAFSHDSTGAVISDLRRRPDIAAGKLVLAMCRADPHRKKWSRPACIIWILGFAW